MDKDKRIEKEIKRLKRIYQNIDQDKYHTVEQLIHRAAYMLASLEEYEKDLDEKGYVEYFSQSDKQEPYERERPVARLYNTTIKNYQSIIRQLTNLLPDKPTELNDGFDDFLAKNEK